MKNTLLLTIGLIAGFLVNLFLQTAPDPISLHSKDPEKIPSTAVVSAEIAQLKIEKKELLYLYNNSLKANSDTLKDEMVKVKNSVAIDSFRDKSFVYDTVNKVIKLRDPSKSVFIPDLGLVLVDKKESIASGLKSTSGDVAAILKFENTKADPVHLFWIDYAGSPVLYKTIKPGEAYQINTYMTHPWVVTDFNGNRIGDIEAELPGKTEVIPLDH